MPNWHLIDKSTPPGMGAVLLRTGSGALDPVFVGYQADSGRWFDSENREVQPRFYARIPDFDAEVAS